MSASPQERALRRDAFRKMNAREKLDYIFTYYKLPILLGVIALAVIGSAVHRQLTKKEAVLYAAFINVSVGESLEDTLTTRFIARSGESVRKNEVYLYRDLYLSDDASVVNPIVELEHVACRRGVVEGERLAEVGSRILLLGVSAIADGGMYAGHGVA